MSIQQVHSHKDLIVWQKGMDLVVLIYDFTKLLPPDEKFGLISQMRRCSVSIVSNIAEGRRRSSRMDFRNFLFTAYASGAELEAQLEIVCRLKFGKDLQRQKIESLLSEIMRMLNVMLQKFENPKKLTSQ